MGIGGAWLSPEILDRTFLGSNVQLANPLDEFGALKQLAGYVIEAASSSWLIGNAAAVDPSSPWWQGLLINDAAQPLPGYLYADPNTFSNEAVMAVPQTGRAEAAGPLQPNATTRGELDISMLVVDVGNGVTSNFGASGLIVAAEVHYLDTNHYLAWTLGAEPEMTRVSYLAEVPAPVSSSGDALQRLRIDDYGQGKEWVRVLPTTVGEEVVDDDAWLNPDAPEWSKRVAEADVAEAIEDPDDEPRWISLHELSYRGGGLMRKRRRS